MTLIIVEVDMFDLQKRKYLLMQQCVLVLFAQGLSSGLYQML